MVSRSPSEQDNDSSGSVLNLTRHHLNGPEGIRVNGSPHLMRSPYKDAPLIDISGLDPGTMVECPSTHRPIRIPEPTPEERAIARNRKTLRETMLPKVQVQSQSFEDVPTWFAEYTDIPIILDRAKITEFAPETLKVPITFDLINVPAEELLRYVSMLSEVPHKITAEGVVFSVEAPETQ